MPRALARLRQHRWRLAAILAALIAASVVGVFFLLQTQREARACRRCPNVLVFETDDQTVADMAALPRVRSLIGRSGVTFTNSFVNYPDCCPSRATFLTGEYAHNHGVLSNHAPDGGFYRLDSTNTLAVWMHDAGYHTVMIGKYLNDYGTRGPHLVPPGWDEWYAGVASPNRKHRERGTKKNKAKDDSSQHELSYYRALYNRNGHITRLPHGLYRTDADAATARKVIEHAPRHSRPFFLWLTFLAPHEGDPPDPGDPRDLPTPTVAPRDRGHFRSLPLPKPPDFNEADVSDKPSVVRKPRLTPARERSFRTLFQQRREALLAVDRAVASILSTLKRTGQLDNTLIIFTSDNGYMLGEHRLGPRQEYIYEPAIRVPLLMRGPGIPHDVRRDQLVSNADLAPTIVDAAHADPGLDMDGRSLLPLARSSRADYNRDILIMVGKEFNKLEMWGVRSRRYAYAEYANGETELYDLSRDPFELTNRSSDPAYASIRAKLRAILRRLRHCHGEDCS